MKSGIFVANAQNPETFDFTARNGFDAITTAITNPFKPNEGVIGLPKVLSHIAALGVGNMLGYNALAGGVGIAVGPMKVRFI